MRASFIFFLFIFSFQVHGQATKGKSNEEAIFTIGKKPVTIDEFVYLYKKNYQNKKEEFTKEKIGQYLDLFINFKLKVAEARSRGLDTTANFLKEFSTYREELRKPYLPDAKIIDSLVSLTYERMKEEVRASHILITLKPDASTAEEQAAMKQINEIRQRAVSGEDFGKLAQLYSQDPSAKENNGDLGYFTAMQMVYPFESAAFSMAKGEVSMPIRTRFGLHILRVADRRPSQGEVEVAHILIRTGDNKDNAQAKNSIFDVYDQLQKGVSWNELCKQYSEDPGSKDNGGKLRPFGIGVMRALPEFEKVAFELEKPGDYSDPFQTQYGWHILRLERKIPLQSFEEMQASLKNRVSRDERVQISKSALYDKQKTRFDFVLNRTVGDKILESADTTLRTASWKPSKSVAASEVLISARVKNFTAGDFYRYVQRNQKPNKLDPRAYLSTLLKAFEEAMLIEMIEADITSRVPEYKWIVQEYYEGILLFDIMEKEVWGKASADTTGQLAFFESNKSKYTAGERVKATLYSSTTLSHLDAVKTALEVSDSVKVKQEVATHKIKQESGAFEKDDRIILSKIPWQKGIHRGENNNLHYLVHVKEILPPGPKTFTEARPDVISDYQNFVEQNWVKTLKKKYDVSISKKGKEKAISELLKTI